MTWTHILAHGASSDCDALESLGCYACHTLFLWIGVTFGFIKVTEPKLTNTFGIPGDIGDFICGLIHLCSLTEPRFLT